MKPITKTILKVSIAVSSVAILLVFGFQYQNIATFLYGNDLEANGKLMSLLIQTLGGIAIFGTLWISLKRAKTLEESNKLTNKQLLIIEKGNITERFTKAIEQLSNPKTEIRLGGIYALYSIAKDSEEYKETICEILCAFIRSESKNDIDYDLNKGHFQTIINFFKTDNNTFSSVKKNLNKCVFKDISFDNCNMSSADFSFSRFENCTFYTANFNKAVFFDAEIKECEFLSSNFDNILGGELYIKGGKIEYTSFINSVLIESTFKVKTIKHCVFESANLREASFSCDIEDVNFTKIIASNCNFNKSKFKDCDFDGARLNQSRFICTSHDRSNFRNIKTNEIDFSNSSFKEEQPIIHFENMGNVTLTGVTIGAHKIENLDDWMAYLKELNE